MRHCGSCPKCEGGTLGLSKDQYGPFLRCINCGLLRDVLEDNLTDAQIRYEVGRLHREFSGVEVAAQAA